MKKPILSQSDRELMSFAPNSLSASIVRLDIAVMRFRREIDRFFEQNNNAVKVNAVKVMDVLCAIIIAIFFLGSFCSCKKDYKEPTSDYIVIPVRQEKAYPYQRAEFGVYREQPVDTVIKGEYKQVLSYRRHNLQDMMITEGGAYKFYKRDSIAVAVLTREASLYTLTIAGRTSYEAQTTVINDSMQVFSVRLLQFFPKTQ